jgi:hypothetical protein
MPNMGFQYVTAIGKLIWNDARVMHGTAVVSNGIRTMQQRCST